MKWIKVLFLASGACFFLRCSPARTAANANKHETVVFFDDFSGDSLDRRNWNVEVTGGVVNNEQQAYVDSTATIYLTKAEDGARNGALVLHPRFSAGFTTKEGRKFDFIAGRINSRSKAEFTYGSIAARIKMTSGAGLWPAFWALGNGRWPQSGEIDIMEYVGEPDWTSVALHGPNYSGETPLVNKFFFALGNDVTQWHVYAVDWTKDSLLFKIDNHLVYRVTRPMIENYGKWAFDNPKFLILNFALGGAYPFKTNGVKEPYNGIPASTVDLIKEGKSRMVVDWVKVTRLE